MTLADPRTSIATLMTDTLFHQVFLFLSRALAAVIRADQNERIVHCIDLRCRQKPIRYPVGAFTGAGDIVGIDAVQHLKRFDAARNRLRCPSTAAIGRYLQRSSGSPAASLAT